MINTEKTYYSLSHPEKRIWYTEKFHPGSSMWNIPFTVKFTTEVNTELLQTAINLTIRQNDGLRLRFVEIDGLPKQYVSDYEEKKFDYFDFNTPEGEQEYSAWLIHNCETPFNIIDNDLVYFAIIKFNNGNTGFLINIHHIISDGWSMGLIINRILDNYNKLKDGISISDEKTLSYFDYIEIEEQYLNTTDCQKDKEYWNRNFETIPELIEFHPHQSTDSIEISRKIFTMPSDLTAKIYSYKQENKTSVFKIVLAAFYTYFSKITAKEDIVFQTGVHNRFNPELKNITGMFVNTIPFRINTDKDIEFSNLVRQIEDQFVPVIEHQRYPYDILIKDLREKNNKPVQLSNISIVQYFKDFYPEDIKVDFCNNRHSENAITIYVSYDYKKKENPEIELFIDYNTSIFNKQEIESMFEYISNIIKSALESPSKKLSELDMLSENEKHKLLYEFNNTYEYYPKNKLIHQLFEEQVEKTPDKTALVYKDKKLTYRELNQKANQLAAILRNKGVKPDDIVGILADRSLEMILGVMAIVKSGAAYMPIDSEYPMDRVQFMLEDSQTKILLSQKHLFDRINFNGEIIDIEDSQLYKGGVANPEIINKPSDLAYIIYTSGSTGKPKGVMIEHHSLLNLSLWYKNSHNLTEKDNMTKYAGFGFDASVWEIFPAFISGAALHVISDDIRISPNDLNKYFEDNNITVSFLPTQLCEQFMDMAQNKSLRWLDTGGDKLRTYKKKNFVLANNYGPTEYTVCTSTFIVDKYYDNIPIGKPVSNTRVYILDKFNNLLPQGVPGELCVSGPGVARGYLNRDDLTASKFSPDPFGHGDIRMYKTGDLARWLPDGNIEYLGRIDQQVKIRGFRIELGEIEQVLIKQETIKDAVVIAREDKNENKFLCAYVVSENELKIDEIKKELSKDLPYYMIPVYFVQLDRLPINPNGKVDKKALPDPLKLIDARQTECVKAENEIEKNLFNIWQEIIGIDNFGIDDNFFSIGGNSIKSAIMQAKVQKEFNMEISLKEIFQFPTIKQLAEHISITAKPDVKDQVESVLNETEIQLLKIWQDILDIEKIRVSDDFFSIGGDSIKATRLQAKIEKEFNILIPIRAIFEHPTIKDLSELVGKHDKKEPVKDEKTPAVAQKYYPASSVQKGLFILEQFEDINTTYNIPIGLKIEGKLDKTRLGESIQAVIDRHESLRTSFDVVNGEPVQIIHEKVKLKKNYTESNEESIDYVMKDFVKPFNLKNAPLFRIELVKTAEEKHILLLDFHHIIFDGFSLGIFLKELFELYQGKELAQLKVQYKEFVQWQVQSLKSDSIKKQEEFWLKTFADTPVLDLSTDHIRTAGMKFNGSRLAFHMDKELTGSLKKLSSENGKTLFLTLFTAFNILLSKYTSQEDIIIGTPIIGRKSEEFQKIIGMFVNTLPIRTLPEDNKTFKTFLEEVYENFLNTYDNQDYPLANLIKKLNLERESGRNPLFDVVFVFQDAWLKGIGPDNLKISTQSIASDTAKFDITMDAQLEDDQIKFEMEYRTDLFEEETIKRMAGHFINILQNITENPDQKLKDIKMLSKEEERHLLYDFNQTDSEYPKDKMTHEIFEEQARLFPDNIALEFEDQFMTYKELNEKSNQLARLLRDKGIKADSIVAILLDRSLEMLISIMGILKAGGTYLPIGLEFPEDRKKYMLEDSGAAILISSKENASSLDFKGEIIDFADDNLSKQDKGNLDNINALDDVAYIIYTSGSTGKPKGVMVTHRNLIRLLKNDHFAFNFTDKDVWTMFHSYTFDFSVWEMYGALLFGGKLIIVPKKVAQNPQDFLKLLANRKVTVLNQTPGAFYNLIDQEVKTSEKTLGIRYIVFGGEALNPVMLKEFHSKYPETKLINMYGITETTVHVTFKEITQYEIDNNVSNIGVPIPTLTTYVMDRNQTLVPIGVAGELCVGGDGVAKGYLNRSELTASRFIKNPYRPKEVIYRAGDLAKRLPTGEMVYLGRIDFQVKIRGFRIELGEIENRLLKHPGIEKVIVLAKKDSQGTSFLCAYFTSEQELKVTELREFLALKLPDYMIPSYFIHLTEMPLTSNGKVDRKALPEPGGKVETGVEYVKPETQRQEKLVQIWQDVLGVEKIGLKDNFFALGGHSLKAVTLVARLQKEFDVSVNDIFKYQTIEELSKHITERKDNFKIRLEKLKEQSEEKQENVLEDIEVKKILDSYNKETTDKYSGLNFTDQKEYKNILLTGVTGYLGINLLHDLLEMKDCNIYVLLRGADIVQCTERLNKKIEYYFNNDLAKNKMNFSGSNRIKIIPGDLSKDKFGLDDQLYNELAEKIDCIIHSAAIVKHYGHYEEFYDANVKATQNLLDLANTGIKKDFNQISTISVGYGSVEGKDKIVFTENDADVGQAIDNYYAQTKLEAEKLVIEARANGVNTNIFRIGNIVFNSKSGLFQENIETNGFYTIVKAFVNFGVIPTSNDEVEFSFVDYVSKSVLLLFNRKNLINQTYHIQNSHEVKLSDILPVKDLELNMDKLAFTDFIDYLYNNFEKSGFKNHIENLMLHKGWLTDTVDGKAFSRFITVSDRTNFILDKLGFKWPNVEPVKLRKMIIEALRERIMFLKDVPIFAKLPQTVLEKIAGQVKEEGYYDETEIIWEGDIDNNFYIILDGNVEIKKHSKAGWLGTIGILGPGGFLGEENICNHNGASVIAESILGEVRVLKLQKEDIMKLLADYPEFGISFLKEMIAKVSSLEAIMVNLG